MARNFDPSDLHLELPPAHELVAKRLRRAISLGIFVPGEQFPSERALAIELGVSRVTLRQGLKLLEAEGYTQTQRGRKGRVLALAMSREASRKSLRSRVEEFLTVLEFRMAVESMAAGLAATRKTDADLDAAAAAIRAMESAKTLHEFRRADTSFHLAVAAASQNAWLRDAIEESRAAIFLPLDTTDMSWAQASSAVGHRRVLSAIQAGNPLAASDFMRGHLEETRRDVIEGLQGEIHDI